ncbi:hypothetical protein ARHIZOSPH14_29470 [Agromyces rhizosphaerae]|uniref:Peptidase S11 D-alanyl-D-alanine carboxypeptidase A N-terminal domain-containing protein n=1 Tax=Agromyces rhizosphaerae TaxID=88374 RepID=A0A9W6CYM3_9MICO|nr:serine hydrolase [Agromyces rhizosphaerae]GLI28705.1 hypothetical protein ARHIZOSPH14_29470 [Agromyces rhizosphaerae]
MPGPLRALLIGLGALAIIALGLYGPATLLGPLPAVAVQAVDPGAQTAGTVEVELPDAGASSVVVVDPDSPETAAESVTLAEAGIEDPVPIAGVAKLVLALAVLEAQPLAAGEPGPDIPVTPADYEAYVDYRKQGARTVQTTPGDTWTMRDMLRAVVLGSSNNHADGLARWAFGSVDGYTIAGNAWLAEHGIADTVVVDATGLSDDNVGTAADAARLGAYVAVEPALVDILATADERTYGERAVPDVSAHDIDGVRGLSRSYTNQAGLCFVFLTTFGQGDDVRVLSGAFLRMPDYDTLDPAVTTAIEGLKLVDEEVTVITEGDTYAVLTAPWGDRAEAVAASDRTQPAWNDASGTPEVVVEAFSTGSPGDQVGSVTVPTADGDVTTALELDAAITDPGPIWRLTHPSLMLDAFFAG